jgi:DNA topoisomerase VI subunit B
MEKLPEPIVETGVKPEAVEIKEEKQSIKVTKESPIKQALAEEMKRVQQMHDPDLVPVAGGGYGRLSARASSLSQIDSVHIVMEGSLKLGISLWEMRSLLMEVLLLY